MESRFYRDLRLLMAIGGATAALILGAGLLALRGTLWEATRGVVRELVYYAAGGVGVLALVGGWAWGVARRVRRGRERGGPDPRGR